MALRATWQRHAGPRDAYAAYVYVYIFYIIYIVRVFSLPYFGMVFETSNPSGVIKPTGFTNLFRVGLKSHIALLIAGHVAQGEALDRDWSAPIEWTRGPRITDQAHALLNRVITATIECDVAASHTLIAWTRGPPDLIKACVI